MKNSILYKVYLKRMVPIVLVFSILVWTLSGISIVFTSNLDTFIYIFGMGFTGVVMFSLMRSPKDYEFINSLPITKKQQWISMYLAALTIVGIVYVQYIGITCIRCHDGIMGYDEIVMSGMVKWLTAILVTTLLMWIFSHTDFKFVPTVFFGSVVILVGLYFVGEFAQKAFELTGNNMACEIVNRFTIMTLPREIINRYLADGYSWKYDEILMSEKIITMAVYAFAVIILTALLAINTCKNYIGMNLEKEIKKGRIRPFNRVIVALFTSMVAFSIFGIGYKIIDKATVDIRNFDWYFDNDMELPEEDKWYDDNYYEGYVKEECVYSGYYYFDSDGSGTYWISKYNADFSNAYLYGFIGALVVSIGIGCAVSVYTGKRKGVEG